MERAGGQDDFLGGVDPVGQARGPHLDARRGLVAVEKNPLRHGLRVDLQVRIAFFEGSLDERRLGAAPRLVGRSNRHRRILRPQQCSRIEILDVGNADGPHSPFHPARKGRGVVWVGHVQRSACRGEGRGVILRGGVGSTFARIGRRELHALLEIGQEIVKGVALVVDEVGPLLEGSFGAPIQCVSSGQAEKYVARGRTVGTS